MLHTLIVVLGLLVFEIVSSIDNAIINAHVLKTMPERFRKIFLFWGILFAVFIVRGVLVFGIVWIANPSFSFWEVIISAFSNTSDLTKQLEFTRPLLLMGGGVYLFMVFLAWLFLEEKKYAHLVERFMHRQGMWFYAVSSVFFTVVIYISIHHNPLLALSASIGATVFFITDGFKKNAEEKEKQLLDPKYSAWSKILYLEALDSSFSIDGVIGAFAFTVSVPLIMIGNGLGAFIVREFTIKGMGTIAKFVYLKNGAMYSIGMLGGIMVLEGFGKHYPFWLAPLNTFALLIVFLWLSWREIRSAPKELAI